MEILVNKVYVPKERQRKAFGDIEALAASMQRLGQIQPIVVVSDEVDLEGWTLVSGERRLKAAQKLKWTSIEAIRKDSLAPAELALIELEENVRRKALAWTEEIKAASLYVKLSKKSRSEAAQDLCVSEPVLSNYVVLVEAFEEYPHLENADSWSAAYKQLCSINSRKGDAIAEAINSLDLFDLEEKEVASEEEKPEVEAETPRLVFPIEARAPQKARTSEPISPASPRKDCATTFLAQEADFREWATSYAGPRFNLIHCDFPYGLNMHKANLQNSSPIWDNDGGRYPDTPQLFEELLRSFIKQRDRFIADSAHIIFWLAPKNYHWVFNMLNNCNFVVSEYPLIWHKSDNAGIVPDVRRTYRRTYEMALFATRGDRKIVKPKAASIAAPTTKVRHLSEKPFEVVTHFLEALVDETTEIFDPTCGGGNALFAAKKLGAARLLGLDIDPEHISYVNSKIG